MPDTQKPAAARLATAVQFLKGAGPRRAELLARLELRTAADVLFCFPRDYQDLTEVRAIADLEEGPPLSVRATVVDAWRTSLVDAARRRPRATGHVVARQTCVVHLAVLVRDEHDPLRAMWFNQPQMHQRFRAGDRLLLSGKAKNCEGIWIAVGNSGSGFVLFQSGESNTLQGNMARENGTDGFLVHESNSNTLKANTALQNGASGFHLTAGETGAMSNVFQNNSVMRNTNYGPPPVDSKRPPRTKTMPVENLDP